MEYDEDGQEWLGVNDVAALVSATGRRGTVHVMLSETRKRIEAEGSAPPYLLPLPDRRVKRPVPRVPPWKPTAQWTPQWRRETIDGWQAARADPASYAQAWSRPTDGKGKFVAKEPAP